LRAKGTGMPTKIQLVWVLGATLLLGGCFEEDNGNSNFGGNGGGSGGNGGSGNGSGELNQPPNISGSPPANILEGEFYEFLPSAVDPDGDPLEFAVARKPAWAKFDKASGRLWGTPGADDVGNFTNIGISVSDGKATATLSAFDVSVNQIAAGAATLSWNPPTENADGSPLTDLAGYRIYYGRNPDNLTQVVVLNNPGLTRHVVENLTPARWHFEMTSVNADGAESTRSQTASKTIG
jgi:hypothetical protein